MNKEISRKQWSISNKIINFRLRYGYLTKRSVGNKMVKIEQSGQHLSKLDITIEQK